MPNVSVVVAAYNAAPFLEHAVRSALAQTHRDLEVLVVDDASLDATHAVASRLAVDDRRVLVLRHEHNQGVAAARNLALRHASGDWIAVLDADDAWLPERLERLLAASGEADIVSDDVLVVPEQGAGTAQERRWSLLAWLQFDVDGPRQLGLVEFLRHDLGLMKPIIRRRFLEQHGLQYDPELRVAEDHHLYVEALAAGARWLQLPEGYYLYSKRAGSLSRAGHAIARQHLEVTTALLARPGVAADEELLAAVRRQQSSARAFLARSEVFELVRHGRFVRLARLIRAQPDYPALIATKVIEHLVLRARRRLKSGKSAVPARIFET